MSEFAPSNLRLFAFGVGYDVDTFLLDSVAQNHHGSSSYVVPGERLDETLANFYSKVSTPVLTDLVLDFGDMRVYDLYPQQLPDLFSGSQIVVTGRYRDGGSETITLSGRVNQQSQTFRFEDMEFARDSREGSKTLETLPRLWATRKIGHSFLVTENMRLGEAEINRIADDEFANMAEEAAPVSGQDAVVKALEQGSLADADAPASSTGESFEQIRNLGARSFVNVDGLWIDSAFDPENMESIKVAFLSDEYFALVAARPALATAFALGERVIAFADGRFYEVVAAGTETDTLNIPVEPESDEEGSFTEGPTNANRPTTSAKASSSWVNAAVLLGLVPFALWMRSRSK
jgi:Ca-activated chloride channel family protein